MNIEIYEKPPEDFRIQVEVAACYVEVDGRCLFLECSPEKSEPGRWGVPAGKIEAGESIEECARRELMEETGVQIDPSIPFRFLGSLFMRKPAIDYVYHLFSVSLTTFPSVYLSKEHRSYKWASFKEIEELPLMAGSKAGFHKYRSLISKKRAGAIVQGYLVLKKDDKILFGLRKNTGYCDGMWSLVAGHIEDGESASIGMAREAKEELGIDIDPAHLKVIHVMHRKTNRLNVDIFFECTTWKGDIQNQEIEKCEKIEFFSLEHLPSPVVDYNVAALESALSGIFYSERGWET